MPLTERLLTAAELQGQIDAAHVELTALKAERQHLAADQRFRDLDDNSERQRTLEMRIQGLTDARGLAAARETDARVRDRLTRFAEAAVVYDDIKAVYHQTLARAQTERTAELVDDCVGRYRQVSSLANELLERTGDKRFHPMTLADPRRALGDERLLYRRNPFDLKAPVDRSRWARLLLESDVPTS